MPRPASRRQPAQPRISGKCAQGPHLVRSTVAAPCRSPNDPSRHDIRRMIHSVFLTNLSSAYHMTRTQKCNYARSICGGIEPELMLASCAVLLRGFACESISALVADLEAVMLIALWPILCLSMAASNVTRAQFGDTTLSKNYHCCASSLSNKISRLPRTRQAITSGEDAPSSPSMN